MYYPIARIVKKSYLTLQLLLLIFISIAIFQSYSYAAIFSQEAEDYHVKGYDEQKKGDFDKALTNYSKALSLGLETAPFFNDWGVLYEQLGVRNKAEEFYLKALRVDPDYLPPYTNLAYLFQAKGDVKQATDYLLERIRRAPEKDPWLKHLKQEVYKFNPGLKAQMESEAKKREAVELKKQLVQKAREDFNLQVVRSTKHYQKGQQLFSDKQYAEALREVDRALTLTPNNPKILKFRDQIIYENHIAEVKRRTNDAIVKLDSGDVESAKKEFQHILTIIPNETTQTTKYPSLH